MSIVQSLKDYILTCPHIEQLARIYIDNSEYDSENYSICPTAPAQKISEYLNGDSLREYHFNLQITKVTIDEASRLNNSEFNENFATWLENNSKNNILPILDNKKQPLKIQALNNGFLMMADENATQGVYQIPCVLTYIQKGI